MLVKPDFMSLFWVIVCIIILAIVVYAVVIGIKFFRNANRKMKEERNSHSNK